MFSLATDSGSALCDLNFESQGEPSPLRKFLFDKQALVSRYSSSSHGQPQGAQRCSARNSLGCIPTGNRQRPKCSLQSTSKRGATKAGIARESLFEDAWRCSEFEKLIHAFRLPRDEEVQVTFYNPTKGTSLLHTRTNAARRALFREVDRPISEPNGEYRDYTSSEITRSTQYFYPDAELNADGVLVVECPKCRGTRGGHRAAYPTLRFNPDKGRFGVMYCGADMNNRGTKCDYGLRRCRITCSQNEDAFALVKLCSCSRVTSGN